MSFTESIAPDITETIPAPLPGGASDAYPASTSWDVTIGALGFNLASTREHPYRRGTESSRKQQFDASDSPGEQSLSAWWTRSQDSWDMGAGITWYEPGSEPETVHRFGSSQGVDVWTRGQFSLLPLMELPDESGSGEAASEDPVYVSGLIVDGDHGWVEATGDSIAWFSLDGLTAHSATLADDTATQPAAAGGLVWVGHAGGVSLFDPATDTATEKYTCTGDARVWWVKSRLIVAVGESLYEVTPGGTGVVEVDGTLLLTHSNADWVWSDVAEVGGAILAAGFAGDDSAVFRFTVEQDENGLPVLSAGSQVADMPPGERISCMGVYLGAYLVLGTTSGVRVGFANEQGSVSYGPLTVELGSAPTDVTFRDRFAYLSVTGELPDGSSGVVRVDLSAEVEDTGRFAWAWDVTADVTDDSTSLCLIGDRVVLACGGLVYVASETTPVATGWLNTGQIRFGTIEPKAYRLARLNADVNTGQIGLFLVDPDGNETRIVNFTSSFTADSDVTIRDPNHNLHQYLAFKITLTANGDSSPVVYGLQIKALPAGSLVRLVELPLMCFDFEKDRHQNEYGYVGAAWARLAELESLERTRVPVTMVDNRTGESATVMIDSVDFTNTAPPFKAEHNFGGVITTLVRQL